MSGHINSMWTERIGEKTEQERVGVTLVGRWPHDKLFLKTVE